MKELCTCVSCATPYSGYVTPWCDLLKGHDTSCAVLHLWYKIAAIQEEIDKRSSYLGKFRRTEEAQHLLDLIRFSKDEENMFIPFAKAAQADVFEVLFPHMPRHEKSYWWNEGTDTVVITDTDIDDGLLHLSELSKTDDEGYLLVDEIPVDEDGNVLVYESGVDEEGYIVKDDSQIDTIPFYSGQYVELKGGLYKAIEDGSNKDYAGKLVPTEDYRNSMHYGILWRCKSNINAVEPLDVAIFETLVARIIYKWLEYAYPDEAARFLNQYNEGLAAIQSRAKILDGPKIVERIPRP